jgi:hypothetical protein
MSSVQEKLEQLERRTNVLERQMRVWRFATLLTTAFGVMVVGPRIGQAQAGDEGEVTKVKAPFQVVDSKGMPVMVVAERNVTFFDGEGAPKIVLGINPLFTGLSVVNEGRKLITAMGDTPSGGKLAVANASGRIGTVISTDADGGVISVYNRHQKAVSGVAATNNGGGTLFVHDQDEKPRVVVMTTPTGGHLGILNTAMKQVVSLETTDDGARLDFKDGNQRRLASLGVMGLYGGRLGLLDQNGQAIGGIGAGDHRARGLVICDERGQPVGHVVADEDGGSVGVVNGASHQVGRLAVSRAGDGLLEITNRAGKKVFAKP